MKNFTNTNRKSRPRPTEKYWYWEPEHVCVVCFNNIADFSQYWLETPCCKQERSICYYCFINHSQRKWGVWSQTEKWCKCSLCNAKVNLVNNTVVRG